MVDPDRRLRDGERFLTDKTNRRRRHVIPPVLVVPRPVVVHLPVVSVRIRITVAVHVYGVARERRERSRAGRLIPRLRTVGHAAVQIIADLAREERGAVRELGVCFPVAGAERADGTAEIVVVVVKSRAIRDAAAVDPADGAAGDIRIGPFVVITVEHRGGEGTGIVSDYTAYRHVAPVVGDARLKNVRTDEAVFHRAPVKSGNAADVFAGSVSRPVSR